MFYAFLHGNEKPETRGTLAEIETALGLRPAELPQRVPAEEQVARNQRGGLRPYLVTITPKIVTYAGTQTFGETNERLFAKSRDEAIKKARAKVREAEGTMGVACTYRAKLDTDQ